VFTSERALGEQPQPRVLPAAPRLEPAVSIHSDGPARLTVEQAINDVASPDVLEPPALAVALAPQAQAPTPAVLAHAAARPGGRGRREGRLAGAEIESLPIAPAELGLLRARDPLAAALRRDPARPIAQNRPMEPAAGDAPAPAAPPPRPPAVSEPTTLVPPSAPSPSRAAVAVAEPSPSALPHPSRTAGALAPRAPSAPSLVVGHLEVRVLPPPPAPLPALPVAPFVRASTLPGGAFASARRHYLRMR
jgi:hypothetical protein